VAQYLIAQMRDELPGIVTVSRVKMPADLRAAKVFVSVLNFEGQFSEVIETLQRRAPEIQRFISDHLRTRYCPKLTFMEDDVTQKVLKVESILRDIANEPGHAALKPNSKISLVPDSEESDDD